MEQLKVVMKELTRRTRCVYIDVPNFKEKTETSDVFESEPFFTFPSGYKMKFIVYCSGHGDGKGTHLSVYTQLLDVPYRDHLQWPFRGTVSVKLWELVSTIEYHNSDAKPGGDPCDTSRFISFFLLLYTNLVFDLSNALHFNLTIQEHAE